MSQQTSMNRWMTLNAYFKGVNPDLTNRSTPAMMREAPLKRAEKNPEYFYLKTRDYVTFLRRTLGFSRFKRLQSQEHSLWDKNDSVRYKYAKENPELIPLIHLGMGLTDDFSFEDRESDEEMFDSEEDIDDEEAYKESLASHVKQEKLEFEKAQKETLEKLEIQKAAFVKAQEKALAKVEKQKEAFVKAQQEKLESQDQEEAEREKLEFEKARKEKLDKVQEKWLAFEKTQAETLDEVEKEKLALKAKEEALAQSLKDFRAEQMARRKLKPKKDATRHSERLSTVSRDEETMS